MSTNRKRHSQRAIKAAFCELLKEHPIDKVYVKSICAKADYSTMAFYASYQDKYDLARKIIEDEVHHHVTDNTATCRQIVAKHFDQDDINQVLTNSSQRFFERVQDQQAIYECIFNNRLVDDGIGYFAKLNTKALQDEIQFINHGDANALRYQQFFIEQTSVMLLNAAKYWLNDEFAISAAELAKLYTRFKLGWLNQIDVQTDSQMIRIALA